MSKTNDVHTSIEKGFEWQEIVFLGGLSKFRNLLIFF